MKQDMQPTGTIQPPTAAHKLHAAGPLSRVAAANGADLPFDPELLRSRIYIKDWSLFTGDSYLMVNPEEVTPQNEPRLTAKLLKHYSILEPSYFSYQPRAAIAASLASYVPLSLQTRKEKAVKTIMDLYLEEKTGEHPEQAKHRARYERPYEAQINFWKKPEDITSSPELEEMKQNALAVSLIVNEGLKMRGRNLEAAGYIEPPRSADDTVGKLAPLLGVRTDQLTQALMGGGAKGLGALLGVNPQLVGEIEQVAHVAAGHEFANNIVENWNMGRSIEGTQGRSVEEKIQVGLLVRTAKKLEELKAYEFPQVKPADIQKVEDQTIASLRQLPQPLLEAFYYSGGEIALTQTKTVENIFGFPVPALGLHNRAPFERGQPGGVLQVYVGSMYQPPVAYNILHHEMNHIQYGIHYTPQEIAEMEQLVAGNAQRLAALEEALTAWERADAPARKAIEAQIDQHFRVNGLGLKEALGGDISDAGMRELRKYVFDAHKNIDPHSDLLTRGYASPEMRATELISRYAELKYFKLENQPAMLHFLTPELTVMYHQYFLPHLEREVSAIKSGQRQLPAHMQTIGFGQTPGEHTSGQQPQAGQQQDQQPDQQRGRQPQGYSPAAYQLQPPAADRPLTVAAAGQLKRVDRPTYMAAKPGQQQAFSQISDKAASFSERVSADAAEHAVQQQPTR